MKQIITIMLTIALVSPSVASAIVVNTSASSHTGGVTAQPGETIQTGSSGSSAHIQTVIVSDERGETADVQVTTEQNGTKQQEQKHYDIPARGGDIRVVATSSVQARTNASGTTASSSVPTSSSTRVVQPRNGLFMWFSTAPRSVSVFWSRFLSLFSR